jgi:hypothetical protein
LPDHPGATDLGERGYGEHGDGAARDMSGP